MSSAPASERYRGERLRLPFRVAPYARRVLVAGSGTALLGGILKKALAQEVTLLEADPAQQALAARVADHVLAPDALDAPPPFPRHHFDMAVLQDLSPWRDCEEKLLRWLAPMLDRAGPGLLALMPIAQEPQFVDVMHALGFGNYLRWEESGKCLLRWVQNQFDPIAMAEGLTLAGHPEWAYNELLDIPEDRLTEAAMLARVHMLALDLLVNEQLHSSDDFLLHAQHHFYHAVSAQPDDARPYHAYARVLEQAGAKGLARSIRASIAYSHAQPAPPLVSTPPPPRVREFDSYFRWPGSAPRVLFVIPPYPHYGLDVLYDGLCEVLGDERVTDWPWKASLHGEALKTLANYACAFNRQGRERMFEEVLEELQSGSYDCLLLGDCECDLPAEAVQALARTARAQGLPVVLVDQMDECTDMRPKVARHLSFDAFELYAKREMAEFLPWSEDVISLPFGFAASKVRPHGTERDVSFFWAGHRRFGLRRLYLEYIEQRFCWNLSTMFPPEEYARQLTRCRMGLSLYGKGYDTVRYWELPAHGAMLLAERPPLQIPHNFVDGESAVFFEDLQDLESKLGYYLNHPEEAAEIARAGEQVYLAHHGSEARARQLLHALHELICRKG